MSSAVNRDDWDFLWPGAFLLTLHYLPQIPIGGGHPGCQPAVQRSHCQPAVQPTDVLPPCLSLQSFIIFVGMSTIALFRPWIKSQPTPKDLLLPPDNKYIYVMPSLLDVFGTIVDTAGLYYVALQ